MFLGFWYTLHCSISKWPIHQRTLARSYLATSFITICHTYHIISIHLISFHIYIYIGETEINVFFSINHIIKLIMISLF